MDRLRGLGLRWWYEDGLGATASKWKRFVGNNQPLVAAIGKQGFAIEESGLFFLKVSIDANSLVDAMLAGKIDNAMQPFRLALGRAASAQPQFDALIKAAQKYFA